MLSAPRPSPASADRSPVDPPGRLRGYVLALAARERSVWRARVALRVGWATLAVAVVGLAAPHAHVARAEAVFLAVCAAGLLGWWAVALPLIRAARLGDPLRQARLVERLVPALRGRMIAATEGIFHPERAASASPALVALLAEEAWESSAAAPPARVHPGRDALRGAMLLGIAWIAVLLAAVLSPLGASGVLAWWLRSLAADSPVAADLEDALVPQARVGDLHLRYTYPGYTGLDPKEIDNSTGDASGPPGTLVEVVARSGEPVEAAGLEAYDETFDVKLGDDARTLAGGFQIRADAGHWALTTWKGGQARKTRQFTITPEPDLAPEVVVDVTGDRVEVALDQPIRFPWRARDDYGVRSVGVEIDGKSAGPPLFQAEGRRADAAGDLRLRPADLGLRAGQTVHLVVAAWDNDSVSGSKPGRSRAIEVVVLGAAGRAALAEQRREEVVRLMLPILAHFLVEEWPTGRSGDDLSRWGRGVSDRYTPLSEAVGRIWTTGSPPAADRALVERVLSSGRELIRYTQVAFTPGATEPAPRDALETTGSLRDAAIVALEDALSSLDALSRMQALGAVARQTKDLAKSADALEERMKGHELSAQETMTALDALDRSLGRLGESARDLGEGGLRDLVAARQDELHKLMEEVRRATTEGRQEDAEAMTHRVASQLRQLRDAVQSELDAMRSRSDQSMDDAKDLLAQMKELEERQRSLQADVKELKDRQQRGSGAEVGELWEQLDAKSAELAKRADALRGGLEEAGRPFYEVERARAAQEESTGLKQAVGARDLRGSDSAAEEAWRAWNGALLTGQREARKPGAKGPAPVEAARGLQLVEEVQEILDKLHEAAGRVDPAVAGEARELQQKQEDLGSELQQVSQGAQKLGRSFPVRPDGLQEALDEAGQRMESAGEDLGNGQPMPAEGSQGVAAERIAAAREALERAMQQAAQQQQAGEGGEPGDASKDGKGDGSQQDQKPPDPIDIPTAEEFRTPEEYRRALLEGMEGEVPEEYRALKKRYYEELVAQ